MLELIQKQAERLHQQGFAVIPTGADKNPLMPSWQNKVGSERVTPNGNFESTTVKGVGLPTGHEVEQGSYLLAIDVDCYDKIISSHMCNYISELIGESMPYRIGQRPKFLVPVLSDKTTRKLTSAAFVDPLGIDDTVKSRIEVLGLGQQFVAYGEHPKAKYGMYEWHNGEFNLETTPHITLDQIHEIISEFERVAQENGLEQVSYGATQAPAIETDDFTLGLAKSDVSLDEARAILFNIDPDIEYHQWVNVGMALHHEFDGSQDALKLWTDWSNTGVLSEHNEGTYAPEHKWETFTTTGAKFTFRSLCHLAKQHGADLSAIAKQFKQVQPEPEVSFDDQIEQAKEQHKEASSPFRSLTFDVIDAKNTVYWTVEDIIEHKSLVNFYGESGVGKSYLAIDFALSIATGENWNGKRTKQGKVLYVAGEGHGGVVRRAFAWLNSKNITSDAAPDFRITERALNITTTDDVALLELELERANNVSAVFIDTWGRATSGINENLGSEVQPIIERLAAMSRTYNCTVIIVHHTPKHTAQDSAGSKNIKASMDVELALVRKEGVQGVVLESRKMKEGEPFEPMVFKFIPIDLPSNFNDEYGKPMRSAVLELQQDSAALARASRRKLSPTGEIAYQAYNRLFAMPNVEHIPTPSEIMVEYAVFGVHSTGITETQLADEMRRLARDSQKSNPTVFANAGIKDAIKKGYLVAYQHPDDPETNVISRVLESGETG